MFLPMAESFPVERPADVLREFYKLFLHKNAEREQQIASIDRKYERDMQNVEGILEPK